MTKALDLYGISTCDTCKKAVKELGAVGFSVTFGDIRAQPLSAGEIDQIVAELSPRAVNTQSTTYCSFSTSARSEPEAQIAAQPSVMKAPRHSGGGCVVFGMGWRCAFGPWADAGALSNNKLAP
ncbi:MAG: hypothetical protein U5N55_05680 [Cypionkella sp.]|nr:hypothetical protein [Cypionkella sp.]